MPGEENPVMKKKEFIIGVMPAEVYLWCKIIQIGMQQWL